MKKVLSIVSVVLLGLYCVAVIVVVLSPLNPRGNGNWFCRGGDFMLRMTEIDCVMEGVNPYDVWHGDIVRRPYLPNLPYDGAPRRAVEGREGFTEEINAYAPWEYIMMMPLALIPKRTLSWLLYFTGMMVALFLLFLIGRSFGRRFLGCDGSSSCLVGAAPLLLTALPIYQNFHVGNLAVPVLLAAALMTVCLNRGHDMLAGVCWAFAMLKPQLGLIFAIPLLMKRKLETCFVAAAICITLTFVASFVCNASPLALILQTPAANTFAFMGCGTFPYSLCPYLPGDSDIVVGLVVGAVLCAWLTWTLTRAGVRDWLVLLMPAAVIGASWTYAQCYSFTMNWFFFVVLCAALVKWPRSPFVWVFGTLSAVTLTRVYNFAHYLPRVLPGIVPEIIPAESWHYHVDSLVTLAGLVTLSAFCVWLVWGKRVPRAKMIWQ